jgi:hypothetical protein
MQEQMNNLTQNYVSDNEMKIGPDSHTQGLQNGLLLPDLYPILRAHVLFSENAY